MGTRIWAIRQLHGRGIPISNQRKNSLDAVSWRRDWQLAVGRSTKQETTFDFSHRRLHSFNQPTDDRQRIDLSFVIGHSRPWLSMRTFTKDKSNVSVAQAEPESQSKFWWLLYSIAPTPVSRWTVSCGERPTC